MKELLTHSRQDCFKTCRRKHYFAYELGLRRTEEARALRIGSAFHDGIEQIGKGNSLTDACTAARKHYASMPETFDAYDWAIECETVLRLICGYEWRWRNFGLENIKTEFGFSLPLLNPESGKPTPNFDIAGKIDGIVRLEDGRLAVKESKTVSDDVGMDSTLWRRLRMDHQISLYIHAARRMGFQVDTVLYDVARKPSIAPTAIPFTDSDGLKIVLDGGGSRVQTSNGKSWRQTADKEKGYVLQTRRMEPSEWGEKLAADICERPNFYFARVEIPRLDQDVNDYQHELWDIQRTIRDAQLSGRWYRTVGRNTCGYCSYFDVCSTNQQINPAQPPSGFEIIPNVHPELGKDNNVNNVNSTDKTTAASTCETVA